MKPFSFCMNFEAGPGVKQIVPHISRRRLIRQTAWGSRMSCMSIVSLIRMYVFRSCGRLESVW